MSDFETRRFGDVTCIKDDCLNLSHYASGNTVSFAFFDLPYKITSCKWDVPINTALLWKKTKNILKVDAVVAATGTLRFTHHLMQAITHPFKYDLVWTKTQATGFLRAKLAPLRAHESILIFGTPQSIYNPQMRKINSARTGKTKTNNTHGAIYGGGQAGKVYTYGQLRYPNSLVAASTPDAERGFHPTQKPVALLEWLIATYTNPGDLVLDPTAGSGTTGVAALNLGRRAVLIEKDSTYFEVMCKRIAEHQQKMEAARE